MVFLGGCLNKAFIGKANIILNLGKCELLHQQDDMSSVQGPPRLVVLYRGSKTTQVYMDYFISHYKDPVINQPGFKQECQPGFCCHCSHDGLVTGDPQENTREAEPWVTFIATCDAMHPGRGGRNPKSQV